MKINITNVKQYLDITDTKFDVKLKMLIQQAIATIINYCNQSFVVKNNDEFGTLIFNVNGTITIPLNTINTANKFNADDFIVIRNSYFNNGIYQIQSIENNVLTLNETYTLNEEVSSCIYNKTYFPDEIFGIVCKMTYHSINPTNNQIKSEKLDDVTLEYFSNNQSTSSVLDKEDKNILNKYRMLYKI